MVEGILSRAQPLLQPFLDCLPENLTGKARIVVTEGYATLRHVLPLGLHWFYQKNVTGEIADVASLECKTENVAMRAFLYRHGEIKEEAPPLLLVHGDYSHPLSLLHLAKEAQKKAQVSVFSLYLPEIHRNDQLASSSDLMEAAINKIQTLLHTQKKVCIAAHSKGTILAADRILVQKDAKIASLFAVGGRFHLPEGDESCKPLLRPFISRISDAIVQRESIPEIVSIAPQEDWNAPQAAMKDGLVSHDVEGGHLGGLYAAKTHRYFHQFLLDQLTA